MTVIMAYHALYDRDSKYVASYWKFIIIGCLLAVSLSDFYGAFSFNYLIENYNNNCILESDLVFHRKIFTGNETKTEKIEDRKTFLLRSQTFPFMHLKDEIILDEDNKTIKYNTFDKLYVKLMEIDEHQSTWGKSCDYVKITPMLEGFFAIIWIAMFVICGHGGSSSSGIMPKPWRIVIPAIIFFLIITILSLIHVIFLRVTIGGFCKQLQEQLTAEYSCSELMGNFSIIKNSDNSSKAGSNYTTAISMVGLSTFLWFITLIVMILRCIFVIDFKLVKVTVTSNIDDENKIKKDDKTKHITFDDSDSETSFSTAIDKVDV